MAHDKFHWNCLYLVSSKILTSGTSVIKLFYGVINDWQSSELSYASELGKIPIYV